MQECHERSMRRFDFYWLNLWVSDWVTKVKTKERRYRVKHYISSSEWSVLLTQSAFNVCLMFQDKKKWILRIKLPPSHCEILVPFILLCRMDKKQNKLLEDLYMRDIKLGKHFDVLVCRQKFSSQNSYRQCKKIFWRL